MPGFDQSGPEGQGPVSGKRRGMCQRTDYSAFAGVGTGRGRGRGMGMGQGMTQGADMRRTQAAAAKSTEPGNDLESLKVQYESTRKMMEDLQEKIAALEEQQK